MAKEIERKFLVTATGYRDNYSNRTEIKQAYLSVTPESTVRIRIRDNEAFITVKSKTTGATREEWEYPIPLADEMEMMGTCSVCPIIEKTRYVSGRWEIDEFHGALNGLTLAEIELTSEDEQFERPKWLGREVTDDNRYFNSVLANATELPPIS